MLNTEIYKDIKKYLAEITKGTRFENNVYAVGGCVRDQVMGLPIKDIDLVVSLENGGIEFAKWLRENDYIVGSVVMYERFGTAMFKLKRFPNDDIEVVQTRKESYNEDSRNPNTSFGTIADDCNRRDLTINALYCRISDDKIIDVCGRGLEDIENKIIDTPTNPNTTYTDDPLRILRCIRFSTRFGNKWSITDRVLTSMSENSNRLSIISKERIKDEFLKIMNTDCGAQGLTKLFNIGAMPYIIDGIVWNDDTYALIEGACTNGLPLYARLALLFKDVDNINEKLISLKLSNDEIKEITNYIRLYNKWSIRVNDFQSSNDLALLMEFEYDAYKEEIFDVVVDMIGLTNAYELKGLRFAKNDAKAKGFCMFEFKLPISGNDILNIKNIQPSAEVKYWMDFLIKKSFSNPNISFEECVNLLNE